MTSQANRGDLIFRGLAYLQMMLRVLIIFHRQVQREYWRLLRRGF